MTNEKAIQVIKEKAKGGEQSEGVTKSKLADGLCDVSEAAYYYVKFYEILTSYHMALSERWQGEGRMVCGEIP